MAIGNDAYAVFDAATNDQLSEPMSNAEAWHWVEVAGGYEAYDTMSLAVRVVDDEVG